MTRQATGRATAGRRVRVLRVIARMNMGGPSYHVALLSGRLDPDRYETLLVHGELGRGEASLADLAEHCGAEVRQLPTLSPDLSPRSDPRALASLRELVREYQPDILHTHTAKAGALGRCAAVMSGRSRPIIVHTYHGHVLEYYFSRAKAQAYRLIERRLARVSDRLVAVSQATADDLVRLRVAPRGRFSVIPVGLELDAFTRRDGTRGFRAEAGAQADDILLTFVGRLVRVKRVDVLLRAVALARAEGARVRLAVVGDGNLRQSLEALAASLGLGGAVRFVGYRQDVANVVRAADIGILSSDNEGTPVSLIEAAAAGRPAVATAVGGIPEVVLDGRTGMLVSRDNPQALAHAIARLAADPAMRKHMGDEAQRHVMAHFGAGRMIREIDSLYRELLTRKKHDAL